MIKYFCTTLSSLLILSLASNAFAQDKMTKDAQSLVDLGQGMTLEMIPAQYEMVQEEPLNIHQGTELITIPAEYVTITETIIVEPARTDVEVIPAQYDKMGKLTKLAAAKTVEIPAVTKDIERRVIKTPARVVERVIPSPPPKMIRVMTEPRMAVIKNTAGETLKTFTDMEALSDFLNSRK